jgi:hypothetical protein
MNKLIKEVDRVGIDSANLVTTMRNELKEKIESAYSGTVTPFKIENQKRKDEAKRIEEEKQERIEKQQAILSMMKGASARAIHLPIGDIEDILQDVMNVDLAQFDDDMKQQAQMAKDISLAQLNDAFKYATEKEEARKAKEIQDAEMMEKDDEIAQLKAMLAEQKPTKEIAQKYEITLGDELERWQIMADLTGDQYEDLITLITKFTPLTITEL